MEENKIDPYQILGFVLLSIAFVWYIYTVPDVNQYPSSSQNENPVEKKSEQKMEFSENNFF